MDKIVGHLEVGTNGKGEVIINHPDLKPDADGVGHIVFSPTQARILGDLLFQKATNAECEAGGIKTCCCGHFLSRHIGYRGVLARLQKAKADHDGMGCTACLDCNELP